jgi:hypothetical protein
MVPSSFGMGTPVLWVLAIGGATALVSACGGDDNAPPNPPQQCRDFLDAWCNKSAECELPSERSRVREDCQFVISLDIDCADVRGVSATYSGCIDAVLAIKCVSGQPVEFPDACRWVLLQ